MAASPASQAARQLANQQPAGGPACQPASQPASPDPRVNFTHLSCRPDPGKNKLFGPPFGWPRFSMGLGPGLGPIWAWAEFGPMWTHLALLGPLGQAHLGPFEPIWTHLDQSLRPLGPIWIHWAHLDPSRPWSYQIS